MRCLKSASDSVFLGFLNILRATTWPLFEEQRVTVAVAPLPACLPRFVIPHSLSVLARTRPGAAGGSETARVGRA